MHLRKRMITWILTVTLIGCAGARIAGRGDEQKKIPVPTHPSELAPFKPLVYHPPKPDIVTLENGMTLYIMEDHELPLFQAFAYIRTGAIYEPEDKLGLAGLVGRVMRTGGTKQWTGDELDEELEYLAASVETAIGQDAGTASVSSLSKDMDRAIEIFADVLMHPAFRQDKIDLAKQRTIEGIRRRNDNPGSVAYRAFRQVVYGKDSPWAREPTIETIEGITREDMIAFHQKFYHPNNMMLGLTGDFNKDDIIAKIERAFEGWESVEIQFPDVPRAEETFTSGPYYVEKDITQSNIWIGHLGIHMLNPDWYAVRVMNRIFGVGAMTSRLGKEVRSNRGLAYAVSGAVTIGPDRGIFYAMCQTKAQTTAEAISAMMEVIEHMRTDPITDEEFNTTKERLTNSFVFEYTSSEQIVERRMWLKYYGFADDYLENYLSNIQKVTKEDVRRVAQEYMHPDRAAIVVVGNETQFDQPLSTFGEVRNIPLEQL